MINGVMERLTGRMRHSSTFLLHREMLVLQVEYETTENPTFGAPRTLVGWRDARTSDLSVFKVDLKLNMEPA